MEKLLYDRVVESVEDAGWASPASLLHWVSLPRLALKLTRACHLPQTGYNQLCTLLQYDPAQLCRYLFTLQSSAPATTALSVFQRLQQGNKNLLSRCLICAARMDEQFPAQSLTIAEHFLLQHWLESLQCAFLSRTFARAMELPNCDDIFYAGLLYRCGELALLAQEKQDYLTLVQKFPQSEQRRQQELKLYHVTAPQLSQRILRQLHLPQAYLDAALFHDLPGEKVVSAHPVTRLVQVAHQIVSGQVHRFQDASRMLRNVLELEFDQCDILVESALNQSLDVVESLGMQVPPTLLRQRLLPLPPDDDCETMLESDLQQLRVERIQIKNILSTAQWLEQSNDGTRLLEHMQRSAYLLFGCHQLILFRYDTATKTLRGDNPTLSDSFETAVSIALHQKTLATDCFREQQAIASFNRPQSALSVIDLELMQLCQRQFLVALPVTQERQQWGCILLAFDGDIQNRFNMWQGPLLFFAQQVHHALSLRDTKRHWQQDIAHFERKMFENRFKRLAHEINNPLSIAQNHLHILKSHADEDSDAQEHANVAIEQIESASHILHAAIERMNGHTAALAAVNINELILDVLYLFSSQGNQDMNIVSTLDERLPTIYIDENYLRQVLINLIKNATECCDDGDTIGVTTRSQVNIQGRRHVAIQIQDDGPGLPDTMLDTLFIDTHSHKEGQQGGLGLSIVKDLVDEMGGLISFQRHDDAQSAFTIFLPIDPLR